MPSHLGDRIPGGEKFRVSMLASLSKREHSTEYDHKEVMKIYNGQNMQFGLEA